MTFMYKKTKQKTNEQTKIQAQKKEVDKNKRERYSYYAASIYATFYFGFIFTLTQKRNVKDYMLE